MNFITDQAELPVFLESERLVLSPLEKKYAKQFTFWLNRKELRDKLSFHFPMSVEEEEKWIEGNIEARSDEAKSVGIFSNLPNGKAELIGATGFYESWLPSRRAGVGIFIAEEKYRSQGLGSEALSLLIGYAFDTLNLRKVYLSVWGFNTAAYNCYKKLGFQEIGRYREHVYISGRYEDEILMELFRSDFKPTIKNTSQLQENEVKEK